MCYLARIKTHYLLKLAGNVITENESYINAIMLNLAAKITFYMLTFYC
mgnify:FL=1